MGYRIAVIDDSAVFRNVVQSLLTDEGYEVAVVPSATLAATQVAAFQPDLITLDLRMDGPETGLSLLALLRADPALAATPIIVCSADSAALYEHERTFARYGVRTLEKPFDLEELLTLLKALLPKN